METSQWEILDRVRQELINHSVTVDLFKEFKISQEEIKYIPMAFKDLDVSARTEHGCIFFNKKFLNKFSSLPDLIEELKKYGIHEITHYLQQTTGDGPTQGSTDDNYLNNEAEIQGFQKQLEYISKEDGKEKAEEYVDQVLDHHEYTGKERKNKEKELLKDASPKQLKFDFSDKNKKENKEERIDREKLKEIKRIIDENTDPNYEKYMPRSSRKLQNRHKFESDQLNKLWKQINKSLEDQNDAKERLYNRENEGEHRPWYLDPLRKNKSQTRFKFYSPSDFKYVFKRADQLTPEEKEELWQLHLGGDSEMENFLKDIEKIRYFDYKHNLISLVVYAKNKNNEIIGWALANPINKGIDIFIDRSFRDHNLGTILINKIKNYAKSFYPDLELLPAAWSNVANNFYYQQGYRDKDRFGDLIFNDEEDEEFKNFYENEESPQEEDFKETPNQLKLFASKNNFNNECSICGHKDYEHVLISDQEHCNGDDGACGMRYF